MEQKIDWKKIFEKFSEQKQEWHCYRCGALLAKEKILLGFVEIKCRRCNTVNTLNYDRLDKVVKIVEKYLTKKEKK